MNKKLKTSSAELHPISVKAYTVGDAIKVTFRPNKTGGKRTV